MTDLPYTYTLTEEIVRWTFEVQVSQNLTAQKNWSIAFTNPTAGPWKRMTGTDERGQLVEILRFRREDDRPDLVLVSDTLQALLILEAKDSLAKLLTGDQIKKSLSVILGLGKLLAASPIPAWKPRLNYGLVPGFLWAGKDPNAESKMLEAAYDLDSRAKANPGFIGIVIQTTSAGLYPIIVGRSRGHIDVGRLRASFGL